MGIEQFFNVPAFVVLWLCWNYYPSPTFESSLNTLLLHDSKDFVLINTESRGDLLRNLRVLEATLNDVTVVLLTHTHMDHVSCLVDKLGVLANPKTIISMSRI